MGTLVFQRKYRLTNCSKELLIGIQRPFPTSPYLSGVAFHLFVRLHQASNFSEIFVGLSESAYPLSVFEMDLIRGLPVFRFSIFFCEYQNDEFWISLPVLHFKLLPHLINNLPLPFPKPIF